MYKDEIQALVRGFFEEAVDGANLDAFDRYCSEDYVWHGGADPGAIGDLHGLDRFKAACATIFEAFPDMECKVLDIVVGEDRAAVRFSAAGTHRATFVGVAPTNKRITWTGIGIYRVAEGKIVEEWFVDDSRAIFEQMGVIPVLRETSVS